MCHFFIWNFCFKSVHLYFPWRKKITFSVKLLQRPLDDPTGWALQARWHKRFSLNLGINVMTETPEARHRCSRWRTGVQAAGSSVGREHVQNIQQIVWNVIPEGLASLRVCHAKFGQNRHANTNLMTPLFFFWLSPASWEALQRLVTARPANRGVPALPRSSDKHRPNTRDSRVARSCFCRRRKRIRHNGRTREAHSRVNIQLILGCHRGQPGLRLRTVVRRIQVMYIEYFSV